MAGDGRRGAEVERLWATRARCLDCEVNSESLSPSALSFEHPSDPCERTNEGGTARRRYSGFPVAPKNASYEARTAPRAFSRRSRRAPESSQVPPLNSEQFVVTNTSRNPSLYSKPGSISTCETHFAPQNQQLA